MRVGHVEGLEHRITRIAPDEGVNASTGLLIFALVALPSAAHVHFFRDFREDARAAHLPVDAPAHQEGRVANLFARHTPATEAPDRFIVGINLRSEEHTSELKSRE